MELSRLEPDQCAASIVWTTSNRAVKRTYFDTAIRARVVKGLHTYNSSESESTESLWDSHKDTSGHRPSTKSLPNHNSRGVGYHSSSIASVGTYLKNFDRPRLYAIGLPSGHTNRPTSMWVIYLHSKIPSNRPVVNDSEIHSSAS